MKSKQRHKGTANKKRSCSAPPAVDTGKEGSESQAGGGKKGG